MASNSLQTLHCYHHRNTTTTTSTASECHHFRTRRHSLDNPSSAPNPSLTASSSSSSQFLKPYHITTKPKPSNISSLTAAFYPTTTPTPTFATLRRHLTARDFRAADDETRRLLIQLAGDAAQSRGYVFFSEVKFIASADLRAIDALWREHSDGRYGYSVQRKVFSKCRGDFTRFFIKVGWMKKLEASEVVQYNYRAFPGEFMWEMSDDVPQGHLPLTNALRGTQLLLCILNHPAFVEAEEEGGDDEEGRQASSSFTAPTVSGNTGGGGSDSKKKDMGNRLLKRDYSF